MRTTITLIAAAAVAFAPAASFARGGPPAPGSISPNHQTGQPDQTCGEGDATGSPGNAADAPGSAFNEDPGGTAGAVYAGEQDVNSKNTASVSQYDVACARTQSGG